MKNVNCKNRIGAFLAVTALLLGLRTAVSAEAGLGSRVLAIGPRATYATPKDATKGEWNPGAQLRLQLSPAIGFEGSIDYLKNNFGPLTTIKTYPVQASLLAYLAPGSVISPFLLGGAGLYYTSVTGPLGYESNTSRFGLHAGAGVEVMLNKSLSLDGTYRYVWLESIASHDASALDKNYKDSGSMVTVALNLLF
jgi:opacity protein-like surface antigen